MVLPKAALTRNFPDLPDDLDMQWVKIAKANLELILFEEHGVDQQAKIAAVKRLLSKFKNHIIEPELNCRENWWAAQLVLLELNGNKAIKETFKK